MADDDITPGTVEPYALPEQHPRTEHPECEVPASVFTDDGLTELSDRSKVVGKLLSECRYLFRVCRNPRSDPAWLILEPQLQDERVVLENQMSAIKYRLDQINRFLGVVSPQ